MICICLLFLMFFPGFPAGAAELIKEGKEAELSLEEIGKKVQMLWRIGKIPGLTLVIVKEGEPVFIKGYGYADLDTQTPVTAETLFELASCSKSFTAMAVLRLEKEGLIKLDAAVSQYLPWFYAIHDNQTYQITLKQLLHHTSGIPRASLNRISPSDHPGALEQTVKSIAGIQLNHIPGKHFQYASLNYDILGAIIEKVSGKRFEDYMKDYIFTPLGLTATTMGVSPGNPAMTTGYKMGFFSPRKYSPPAFRGNYPAAYVVSNGNDMARWLKLHLGLLENDFSSLAQVSHQPDLTVPPPGNTTAAAMGWFVNLFKNNETFHRGENPSFSAYLGFRPGEKIGVAVLANINSTYTSFIGQSVLKLLTGQDLGKHVLPGNKLDAFCSIISLLLGIYTLSLVVLILIKIINIFRGKFSRESLNLNKAMRMVGALLGHLPFIIGIYLIPYASAKLSWEIALVWGPISFKIATLLLLAALGIGYIQYVLSLLFPPRSKYRCELPRIAILSILAGLSGTGLIFIVTTSFFSSVGLGYLLYYFFLVFIMNLGGKKLAHTKLINISNNLALDMRVDLIKNLFTSRFQRFEKIHHGRILTTLNGDVSVLARSASMIIRLFTSTITIVSGFIYMATISFQSTLVVLAVVIVMAAYYRQVAKKSRVFLEKARDAKNVYMGLMNSMIRGYKELVVHKIKKYRFKEDLLDSCKENCNQNIKANIKFLNSDLLGGAFGFLVLGILSIVVARLITGVSVLSLISFVMVILYILGPIRQMLSIIPGMTRLSVSWGRIKSFVEDLDIQGNQDSVRAFIRELDFPKKPEIVPILDQQTVPKSVKNFKVEGLMFEYQAEDESEKGFSLGPIDLSLEKGEILFIVGGNGSGKTTIAKLITGLYLADKGSVKIDSEIVEDEDLGEYFSIVFSDYHLFKTLYGVRFNGDELEIKTSLETLKLDKRVQIADGSFSTIDISGGQRKRLALLQCWLENRPIYLFDEVAADQDPEFRKFFYRDLLLKMKKEGKIIIAITHDDHYFDVADKIIKMDMGKIEYLKTREQKNSMKQQESPGENLPILLPGRVGKPQIFE